MQEYNDLAQTNSSQTDTTPLQPMGFTDILDGMFSLYRNHLRLLLAIAAVYFVLEFGVDLVSVSIIIGSGSSTSVAGTAFSLIVTSLISVFVTAGLAYVSAHLYLGREITPGGALQRVGQRFWTYLGSVILWLLVVVGLCFTIIGIPFSIYFSVRWGLYTLPVLFEGTTARSALRRSTELVKGTWWRVFGITLAVSLISFMIYFILEASAGILLSWVGIAEPEEPTGLLDTLRQLFIPTPLEIGWFSYIIRRLVTLSIAALTMPIGVIGSTLIYFDLRIRKEAYDIEMQVTD